MLITRSKAIAAVVAAVGAVLIGSGSVAAYRASTFTPTKTVVRGVLRSASVKAAPSATTTGGGAERLWAVVTPDGALAYGQDVVSVKRIDKGDYWVTFDRSVSQCANVATVGSTSTATQFTYGDVATTLLLAHTSTKIIDVTIGVPAKGGIIPRDNSFNLVVSCP